MEESCKIPSLPAVQEFNLFSVTAGAKKLANKAALWYVPCSLQNVDKVMDVPPIKVHGNFVALTFTGWSLAFYLSACLCLYLTQSISLVLKFVFECQCDKLYFTLQVFEYVSTCVQVFILYMLCL